MDKESSRSDTRLENTIAVLYEIANAVSNTGSLRELYAVAHRSLKNVFPADVFFLGLYDPVQDRLSFPYYSDACNGAADPVTGLKAVNCLIHQVITSGSPRFFSKNECESSDIFPSRPGRPDICAWLGAPLRVKGEVIGAMVIQDTSSQSRYDQQDLVLLNSVAQHVALGLERREFERRIEEQTQILEKILDSSPVGIALIENQVFKWVNTQMLEIFGYADKSDFYDQNIEMIYPGQPDYDAAQKAADALLSARAVADYETDLLKKDGSVFPVHVRLNSPDTDDPMSWIIGSFTDISERRAAQKERFEKERLQGVLEMAGAVCHEINQPLQAILGYTELLVMDKDASHTANSLASIKSQATRLGKITATLANITQYKTLDYPGNTKIVDIWGAGAPPPDSKTHS